MSKDVTLEMRDNSFPLNFRYKIGIENRFVQYYRKPRPFLALKSEAQEKLR